MPHSQAHTSEVHTEMSEIGYRRLKQFVAETGLEERDALSFLFEAFDVVTHHEALRHRLGLYKAVTNTAGSRDPQ
ncbi:hypothetical protein [uncultured Jannaschia sp.]|uniref:hypothetical protein n=1 Tax=uncultured Jannaschia sp. TaxID=293347 RepID=UPI0026356173|nr:hypothetical protein [uncultured Jannaschia sp.]